MTDAAKRQGDVEAVGAASLRRVVGKVEGSSGFVSPETPARSEYEAALM